MSSLQSLEDIESMPPTSLSQTPLFQHLLSSLPSLRGQIKDAVTASMKQWLLDIRNVSAEVGELALEHMELRTRRWRSRREKEPMLKTSRVGSAVEVATNEKNECMRSLCEASVYELTFACIKTMCSIMNALKSTSSHCMSAYTYTPHLIRWTKSENHIKQTERSVLYSRSLRF